MKWFCRRYKLDPRPEHSTETCVVYLATENTLDGRRVAIKFMSDRAQYKNEIEVRKGIATRFWHTHTHTTNCVRNPCIGDSGSWLKY